MSDLSLRIKTAFAANDLTEKDTHEQLLAAQKHRAAECGVAPKDGGHLTCPSGFKQYANDSECWADWTNFAYPICDKAHADDAASRWDDEHNRARYSAQEQQLINARIERAQEKFGESENDNDDDTAKGLTVDPNKQGEPEAVTPEPKAEPATPVEGEKAAPVDETKNALETLTQVVAALAETVKSLVPTPVATPVDEAAVKQAELDRVTAELEAKRAEAAELAQKAAAAQQEYDALLAKAQPSPLATAPEVPFDELNKFIGAPGFDSSVPAPSPFAGKSLEDFLR